jgi:hypothetical protein
MKFVDGLVEIDSIQNAEQARAIVDFLQSEGVRHQRERGVADEAALQWLGLAVDPEEANYSFDYCVGRALLEASASYRHALDMGAACLKSQAIKEKFQL